MASRGQPPFSPESHGVTTMRIAFSTACRRTTLCLTGALVLACGDSSSPPAPVASLAIAPLTDTVMVDESIQLAATLRDANDNILSGRVVTWSSSDPQVASVSNTGRVTGVDDGQATITATSESKTGSATIQVFSVCSTALAPPVTVGQTINGTLATTDCQLTDDTYADGYGIMVATATNVQIDMSASFDTYLVLVELLSNGDLEERGVNDDIDPDDPNDPNDPVNTNSRITTTLLAGRQYFILANSFDPNVTGAYQLSVTAAAFAGGGAPTAGKPGKAPVSSLIKALKAR